MLGATIGSFTGGFVINLGRRKVMICLCLLGILSVIPTLFLNVYTICLGRVALGTVGGVMAVMGPRMIEESVPSYKLGIFGPFSGLFINSGSMIAAIVGGLLLYEDGEPKETTELWKVDYAVPILLLLIQLFLFLIVVTEEPMNYILQNGEYNERSARKLCKKIYPTS